MDRQPQSAKELARAVRYAIEQARDSLGPVTEENLGPHAILANAPILDLIAAIEGHSYRELFGEPGFDSIRVTGWSLDWWPDYPDWVFDKEENATT